MKLREILDFIKKYEKAEPNLDLLMKRLRVVGEFYATRDIGVDRFCFGEDYRPNMMADTAAVVDKKH